MIRALAENRGFFLHSKKAEIKPGTAGYLCFIADVQNRRNSVEYMKDFNKT